MKYLKAKTKSYKGKLTQIFTIIFNSVFIVSKNYYLQVFLEECKYVAKNKNMPEDISDNREIYFDGSDGKNCDGENSDEENFKKEYSNEENFNEQN